MPAAGRRVSATGAVREALRERSAADWRDFLHHRTVELAPGGRLVVVGGAATDEEAPRGPNGRTLAPIAANSSTGHMILLGRGGFRDRC